MADRNARRSRGLTALGLVVSLAAGCAVQPNVGPGNDAGNGDAGPMDAGNMDAGPMNTTPDYLGMPQVVDLNPNSVLATPQVMPISWSTDTNTSLIQAFVIDFAQSSAWADQTSEYGVGALTTVAPKTISGSPSNSYTDQQLENMLTDNLSGNSPIWGAADPNTIYLFLMPAGVPVDDYGDESCTDYDGYHSDMQVGGTTISYAVVAACPNVNFDGPGISNGQQITIAASHELVESATDPFFDYNAAYAQTDDAHAVWTYTTGGEVADLCEFADTFAWTPSDMTHTIQRTYSNSAAMAGTDPCVGDPTVPYYQAIPSQPDQITIDYGGPWTTQGLEIADNATGTLTLKLFSDTPGSGPYTVTIDDYNSVWNGGNQLLQINVPSTPLNVGDTLQATVTVLGQDSNIGNGEVFVVNTTPTSGNGPTTYYFGLIGQ